MKFIINILVMMCVVLNVTAQTANDSVNAGQFPEKIDFKATPKLYVVAKVNVKGAKFLSEQLLIGTTGIMPGDTIMIPGEQLTLAAKKLWDQRIFSDVKVETQMQADSVYVTFVIKERARVVNWKFQGVRKTQEKDLLEKLHLRRGSELSDYLMSTSLRLIKDYFNGKAFRNSQTTYTVEQDTVYPTAVNVTFHITPGLKQKIKEIKIEGLEEGLKPKKVAAAMKSTKPISINIFADTKFKDKEFPEDLQKVADYMHSKGYRDAEVIADSLYTINPKRIGVWIQVKQGKKYYFRDIAWVGNAKYSTEQLQALLGLKKGDTYDSEALEARLGINGKTKMGQSSVDGLYKDDGYLVFAIEPFETVVGDSVDVEIRMVEGRQFRINNVTFEGNNRTNDHVIRRDLETIPGDLYSQSLLLRTYQRLATMGQFDAQSFALPSVVPNPQTETVDIGYSLKEVSNDQFELSLGWGSGMFVASVGVNFTNVSLRKFFDPKAWRPYPAGDAQTFGLKVQSNGTYYRALSVNFTEPWLGGRKPTQLNIGFYTSRESNAYSWATRATAWFGTIGASASIGKRLSWPDPFFTLQFGLQFQSYKMNNWNYFAIRNGISNTIAANVTFARNSVDDPYQYPSMGSNISLSLTLTPPYSSFDGLDYSDPTMNEQTRYRWVEYHKWRLNAQWFFPLTRDRKLVLMARAQYGYLGAYNKDKPSPFEGFQVGGDGLAGYNVYGVETVGLRGYKNSALTPLASYSQYARIFSKYTAELRYPFVRQGSTLVYGLAFFEAGNAYMELAEFKPFELKKAAGIGLRVFLPVLGMLGVDWGYGFDTVAESNGKASGGQFHFTMGMQL